MAKIIISDGIIHSDADFELRSGTDTNLRTRFRICNRNDNHTRIKSLSAHDISVANSLCVNNLTVLGTCTVQYCTLTSCTSAVQNNFVVESTDATATAAPDFRLYRSSATPAAGDNLGNITFEGKNSAAEDIVYGQIMACIQCADDGLERSKLVTSVTGGGNFIEVYGVDCNGLWMCANRSLYINAAGSVRNYGNSLCLSTGGGSHDIIFRPNDSTAATIGANCTNTFGNVEFGHWPANTDYAYVGHKCYDHSNAAYYALLQGCSNGYTYLNGYNRISIRISNSDKMVLTNTSLCTSVESFFTNCVGVGTTSLGGYKLELADDTDSTVNLLRLRNSDATYSQSWDFQLDTNKDLAITGASGDGGVTVTHGSRGTRFCRPSNGYIAVCPSSTWAHFITDRDRYYINKALVVDTGCVTSYDEDLQLRRGSGSGTEAICITNGLTCSNQPVRADGGGAGGYPVLCLVGSCRDAFVWGSSTMYPNLTGGDTAIHLIGKSTGTYNSGYLGFYQVADTCACNFITLGMYSSNHLLNIKGSGEVGIGTTNPADKLVVCGTTNMCKLQLEQGSCRTKIRLYGSSDHYGIGMYSTNCYGGLGATWAMTFQFNDDSSRGFWWGHSSHNVCQGAMSLTTDGHLTLANKLSVGYGESKITGPEYKLDVAEPSGNPPAEPVARICRGNNLAVANQTADYPELLISGHSSNYKLVIRDQANCELMAVKGNGNVGIGTTDPNEKLEVYGSGARIRVDGTTGAPVLELKNNTHTNYIFTDTTSGDLYIRTDAAGKDIILQTCNSSGNVGIGTADPTQKLYVCGNTLTTGYTYISDTNRYFSAGGAGVRLQTIHGYIQFGPQNSGFAHVETDRSTFYLNKALIVNSGLIESYDEDLTLNASYGGGAQNILFQSGGTTHMYMSSAGNVGIGTTSPDTITHLYSTAGDTVLTIEADGDNNNEDDNPQIHFLTDGGMRTGAISVGNATLSAESGCNFNAFNIIGTSGGIKFYTGSAQDFCCASVRAVIDCAGNFGIGTTSPSYNFNVEGISYLNPTSANSTLILGRYSGQRSIQAHSGNSGYLIMDSNGGANAGVAALNWYSSDNVILGYGGGNVGIGTNLTGTCRLYVNGDTHIEPNCAYALRLGRIGGAPNIKAAGDGWMIMDSSGAAVSLNHYTNNNVYIANGGGNVGIGSASASYKLDIVTPTGDGIRLNHSDVWARMVLATKVSQTCAESLSGHASIFTTTPTSTGDWPFNTTNGEYGALVLQSRLNSNGGIVLRTGYSSSYENTLVLRETGNVGIGITNPTQTLQVSNSSYLQLKLHSTASAAGVEFIPNSGNAYEIQAYNSNFFVYDRTQSQYRFLIDSAGKVGIGTNGPDYKLDVRDSTNATRIVVRNDNNAAAGAGIYLQTFNGATQVSNATIRTNNSGSLGIFTGTTSEAERFTINSSGKVGIGTASPDANHDLTIANTANFGIRLTGTNGSICSNTNLIEGAVNNIYLRPSSGYKVYIDSGCGLAVTCGRLDTYSAIGFCYPSNCGPMFESGGTYTNPSVFLKRYDGDSPSTCFGAGHICASTCVVAGKVCISNSYNCLSMVSTCDSSYNFAICSMYNWAAPLTISSRNVPIIKQCEGVARTSIYANNCEILCVISTGAKITGNLCVTGTIQADGVEGDEYTTATCKLNSITCFNVACSTGLDAIYDIYVSANPNAGGSSLYRDVVHLTAYVTTGWNGSAATKYINTVQHFDRGTAHNSGANAVTACVYLYDGASSTAGESFAAGCDTCLQVQIGGGNTATNAVDRVNECVLIKRVL